MIRQATRGQPLVVFTTILGAWFIGRVLLWESPFPLPQSISSGVLAASRQENAPASLIKQAFSRMRMPWFSNSPAKRASSQRATIRIDFSDVQLVIVQPFSASENLLEGYSFGPVPVRTAVGHQMLLAAAYSHMALPPEIVAYFAGRAGFASTPVADRPLIGASRNAGKSLSHWSADGWLLWRNGSGEPVAPGVASYGRSQAGIVVRYRLAAGGMRPEAYARATRTVEGPRQADLAAGLSARPIAALPVRLAAELRISDSAAGRELRPAVFAVTELPPAELPHGWRAEGYAQAGWVGGDFATAFVDGQARIDRRIVRLGEDQALRAGLAAWGGAQKGAARLDIGPSATVDLDLGDVRSRLAVDYRLRVAGDAKPASGPAMTFSAGF